MKNFYFNVQSKGGAGKSMLTYLQALKHQKDENVVFVDLDSSTQTSLQQLNFISKQGRLIKTDIYDRSKKLDRERFIEVIEGLNQLEHHNFYIDFGAPESEQLPGLFTIDFTIDEFKLIEQEMGVKFIFNVIIAGGPAYEACFNYLKNLTEIINGRFDIYAYANEFTFNNYENLLNNLNDFVIVTKGLIKAVLPFGNFHPDRRSGKLILGNIREGRGLDEFHSFATKLILKREFEKINYEKYLTNENIQ